MATSNFHFNPPDRRRMWRQLALTMSQAASLTGVSERQIQHWMDRGYIDVAADGGRKISGESLDCIMLIKQAREGGIPLRQAVPLARAYLAREASGVLGSDMAHWALQDLQDKLALARQGIDNLEQLIADVNGGDGRVNLPTGVRDRVSSQRHR